MGIFDVKLYDVLYRRKENWALRLLSEGQYCNFVLARNLSETLFATKLFRILRTESFKLGNDSFDKIVRRIQTQEQCEQADAVKLLAEKVAAFLGEQIKNPKAEESLKLVQELEAENKRLAKSIEEMNNAKPGSATKKLDDEVQEFLEELKRKGEDAPLKKFDKTLTATNIKAFVDKMGCMFLSA